VDVLKPSFRHVNFLSSPFFPGKKLKERKPGGEKAGPDEDTMPKHTSQKHSSEKTKTKEVKRSQVTGRQIGKAAMRAANKNHRVVDNYLDAVEERGATITSVRERGYILGKVTRALGAGRLEVTLQDGQTDISVPIGGSIKFKGRAGTKTDRENCMCVGDIIVIDGGFAAAKINAGTADRIRRIFAEMEVTLPRGFFLTGREAAEFETDSFEWDRSEEEVAEAETRKIVSVPAGSPKILSVIDEEGESDVDIDDI
jgi:hypothetical protein